MPALVHAISLSSILFLTQCASSGDSPEQRRQAILDMRDEALTELFELRPDVQAQLNEAPGYGAFSTAGLKLFFVSAGGGRGVVRDNSSGENTFMNMGEVGVGLGLGVKDLRLVFVFHDEATLNRFIDQGWSFGGEVDAAAKTTDVGGAVGGQVALGNITVYQMTRSGLALEAVLKGTRYWKNPDLNR